MNIKYIFLFSFASFLILDYFIKKNFLGNSIKNFYLKFIELNYLSIVLILFITVFSILTLFSYFGFSLICFDNTLIDIKIVKFMSDSAGNNNVNVNADATINLNHPRLNVSVPVSALNNAVGAASAAGGMGVALKVAQQIPGSPGVKLAAGAAAFLTTQATAVGMSKILNSNNSNDNTNKFTN
jgi:hypothetical protein